MTPAELLAQARTKGAEFTIIGGKLATRGVPPELRPDVLVHRTALIALLQRPSEPAAAERHIITAVEYLSGWWPLSVMTLCRAMAAHSKPLAVVGCRAFLDHLDTIMAEHEAKVRRIARELALAQLIPAQSVDLLDAPF